MKRDMELCRKILIALEDSPTDEIHGLQMQGYENKIVKYHCDLLKNAGYIEKSAEDIIGNLIVGGLTWEGQDFTDKIRNDTVWNKVKEAIRDKGLSFTLEVVKDVLLTIATTI